MSLSPCTNYTLFITILLLFVTLLINRTNGSKTVSAAVTGPWLSTPQSYAMEASEIISEDGKSSRFWVYLQKYKKLFKNY